MRCPVPAPVCSPSAPQGKSAWPLVQTLDHESTDSYALTLTARDPSGLSDTASVTVNVRDVNEAAVTFLLSTYTRSCEYQSANGRPRGPPDPCHRP